MKRAAVLAGTVLLATLALLAYRHHRPTGPTPRQTVTTAQVPPRHEALQIRVEILNGCGERGVARSVSQRLRSIGFDVITVGNAESFNYPETIVMDRVGKPGSARLVADALGVQHAIQQIVPDPFRIEEVTVIIGRDHRRLTLAPVPEGQPSAEKERNRDGPGP